MKNFILSIVLMMFVSCGLSINTDESLIGTKQFITDTSFIISTGSRTYKITDTSIIKWDIYLFIYNTEDSSDFERGVFTVYDNQIVGGRYPYNEIFLTNGQDNLLFTHNSQVLFQSSSVKVGDKFYCFYKTKSTFKTLQIK
jgi:hypothetical protein